MFKNYFIIALRNLRRQITYSVINILGLAVGISSFMLIALFVVNELSYDRFHGKADRIYRLCEKIDADGQGENSSSNPFFVARAMANDYPHLIEQTVRFFNFQSPNFAMQNGDKKFIERNMFYVDSNVFKMFDFPLIEGDPGSALSKPNSIVITREVARKYFGDENPMGKIIRYENFVNFEVTGILGDIPTTTHINFNGLISWKTLYQFMGPNFERQPIWNPAWTYILLKEGVAPSELEGQFPSFIQKYYPDFFKPQVSHHLQKLTDIHLHSKLDYEIEANGDVADIYIFSVVGILILLISCINFMNLATARSAGRAREVGMRKVMGAHREHLIRQFLGESLFISLFAMIVASIMVELFLPAFNNFSGKQLSGVFGNPWALLSLVGVGVLTGVVSGLYPAFFLSAFQPMQVLKGSFKTGASGQILRKTLVVMQFAISIGLIISAFIVYQQLQFMRNKDIGFTKEAVVIIQTRPGPNNNYEALANELKKNSHILSVGGMNDLIGKSHNTYEINYEGMEADKFVYIPALQVNEDFVPTMGIKILAGRNFSREFPNDDSLAILINEATVAARGWGTPEQALGKQFYTRNGKERVIGVFKNFNYEPLSKPIGPFALDMGPARFRQFQRFLAVRVEASDFRASVQHIEDSWNKIISGFPVEYFFLDDQLREMYKAQDNLAKLVGYFSALAIFIACLGMFALASFTAEQRTKELGIRKTLGASMGNLIFLFSRDFLQLVFISGILASIGSYYLVRQWLEGFAFRMDMSFGVFLFSILIAMVIALVTISYQSLKVATANPIQALKYE